MSHLSKLLLMGLLFACNTPAGEDNNKPQEDTASAGNNDKTVTKTASVTKEQIIGIWTNDSVETASIEIKQDSVYYADAMETYPYTVVGDTITIHYAEEDFHGSISLKNDTMFLSDPAFGVMKYTRVKNR